MRGTRMSTQFEQGQDKLWQSLGVWVRNNKVLARHNADALQKQADERTLQAHKDHDMRHKERYLAKLELLVALEKWVKNRGKDNDGK